MSVSVNALSLASGSAGVQVNTKSLVVVVAASDIGWRVTVVANAAVSPKSAFKVKVVGNAVAWQ